MDEALEVVAEAVDTLAGRAVLPTDDETLLRRLVTVHRAAQQLFGVVLLLVHQIDVAGAAGRAGAPTTTAWLRQRLGVTAAGARRLTVLAAAVEGAPPAVRDALAAGLVGVDQLQAITTALSRLPADAGPAVVDKAAQALVGHARSLPADDLSRLGRRILWHVAPDVAERADHEALRREEASAARERFFTITPDGPAAVRVHGRFDREAASIIRAALDPLCNPRTALLPARPAGGARHDARRDPLLVDRTSATARRAHAHPRPTAARHSLRGRGAMHHGGAVAGEWRAAADDAHSAAALRAGPLDPHRNPAATHHGPPPDARLGAPARTAGPPDPHRGPAATHHAYDRTPPDARLGDPARTARALDPLHGSDASHRAHDGPPPGAALGEGGNTRTAGQRRADALVELCRLVLNSGELPDNGGDRPQVVVTVPFDPLRQALGVGTFDNGDRISADVARRLSCDARILPAVLDGNGQPLDLGRERRLITGALRRALVLRDGGCAFPDCDRPPRWCDGHHVRHWADGGATALDNAVLLCGYHHRLVHDPTGGWAVRIARDGRPTFTPPAWVDPARTPRRNLFHRRA